MNFNNFHYIAVLLDLLYGLELNNEDLEELGLIGWEHIGNKRSRLYSYSTCINGEDNSIQLPCNASSVEAVTASYEDWKRVTNYSLNGDNLSSVIESSIEALKVYPNKYYIPGKLLSYELSGDTLYFTRNYGTVNVLYKGILVDEEGLPEISDKEALAIATYIAWIMKYKDGLKTNNTVTINLASTLELKWAKYCDLARISKLSLNDMNEILNIKNSWDRANYGMSYKPIR